MNVGLPGNTLTEYTAKITGHYQNGFRTNWGIIDNLCILRQVIQKECEYMCFKQVLDSIHRHKTIKIIITRAIPCKVTRLIRMTHGGKLSSKSSYTNVTESFNVKVGKRQDYALSDILFNLVLDYIIKKLDIRIRFSFVFST